MQRAESIAPVIRRSAAAASSSSAANPHSSTTNDASSRSAQRGGTSSSTTTTSRSSRRPSSVAASKTALEIERANNDKLQERLIQESIERSLEEAEAQFSAQLATTTPDELRYAQLTRMLLTPVSQSADPLVEVPKQWRRARTVDEFFELPAGSVRRSIEQRRVPRAMLEPPSPASVKALFNSLSRFGTVAEIDLAFEWLHALGLQPEPHNYIAAISACSRVPLTADRSRAPLQRSSSNNDTEHARVALAEKARSYFEQLLERIGPMPPPPPRTLLEITHSFSPAMSTRKNAILREIEQLKRSPGIAVVGGGGGARTKRAATLAAASAAVKATQHTPRARVMLAASSALISCYERCDKADEALVVVRDHIAKNGLDPDVVIFTQLIAMFRRLQRFDEAWETFDLMRERYHEPDVITFNHMIFVCALEGKVRLTARTHARTSAYTHSLTRAQINHGDCRPREQRISLMRYS